MRIKMVLAFAFILLICASGTAQEWKVYHSEEGGFSVLSPGYMEKKRAFLTTEIGEIEIHTLYFNNKDTTGNFLYLINFYDLPDGLIPVDSTDLALEFLLNTMDQSISDTGGDLQYDQSIEIGNSPGLLWRSRSDKQVVKSRAYIIKNTFYIMQVFSLPEKSLNNDVDRFLESFTLKPS